MCGHPKPAALRFDRTQKVQEADSCRTDSGERRWKAIHRIGYLLTNFKDHGDGTGRERR